MSLLSRGLVWIWTGMSAAQEIWSRKCSTIFKWAECLRFHSDSKKHLWQFSVRLFSHKINSETIVKLLRFWDTEFRVCDLHESHITRFYFYESLPFFVYHYNIIQYNAMQYNIIQYNTSFIVNSPWGLFRDEKRRTGWT